MSTNFEILANLGESLEKVTKRNVMVDLVANFLIQLDINEIKPATAMILGLPFSEVDSKTLEVSWSTILSFLNKLVEIDEKTIDLFFGQTGDLGSTVKAILEKKKVNRQSTLLHNPLTILEVKRTFNILAQVKGSGSKKQKERLLRALLGNASPLEAKYLVKIFINEMRTGFHRGLMEKAISKAFDVSEKTVRKAAMIIGDLTEVALIAKRLGKNGLVNIGIQLFRPLKPMLAQTAEDTNEVLNEHSGESAFEYKLDGIRVQIHVSNNIVKIFSRNLKDITSSFPDLVSLIQNMIKQDNAILDGEVIAVGKEGNPLPFQHLMRRFRRINKIEEKIEFIPVRILFFDLLFLDGKSLIDESYLFRRKKLEEIVDQNFIVNQKVISNRNEAEVFLKEAIKMGHEGLVAKKLSSFYSPGVRGKSWFKIKLSLEPLDLVIVAAEYGYGRRHNWLSNYYLAARNSKSNDFLVVGKTFKGLSDNEIIEMTKKLKQITIREEGRRVIVQPLIVVEVAYNEIQESPKYKSKMALRFARITKIREDKTPKEADTINRIKEIYQKQFTKKARFSK